MLIMVDDMGFSDLGVTGSEIDTPNLDRAARMIRWYETWAERIGARTSAEAEAMPL